MKRLECLEVLTLFAAVVRRRIDLTQLHLVDPRRLYLVTWLRPLLDLSRRDSFNLMAGRKLQTLRDLEFAFGFDLILKTVHITTHFKGSVAMTQRLA